MAEMTSTNEFKTGLTIKYEGNIYQVMDFQHVKPGKGQAFVSSKIKNLRTGAIINYNFQSGLKVEKAIIEKKPMQYLYTDGSSYSFMDMETFEQIDIPAERLEYEKNFMLEGSEVTIIDYEGEILGVMLKEKVELEVVECDPGVKGNTAANARKKAKVETGYELEVPLFIENGDKIIVSTIDGTYTSRA